MIPRTLFFFSTGAMLARLPFLVGFPLFIAAMSIFVGSIILGCINKKDRNWEEYKGKYL